MDEGRSALKVLTGSDLYKSSPASNTDKYHINSVPFTKFMESIFLQLQD